MNVDVPKISVIVPVYNSEDFLSDCLDSIINQNFDGWECICVNDCSNDDSLTILRQYAAKDKRIKIINNEKNSGVSFSRNIGIENSSAKYIMFCDSDDELKPETFAKMLNGIEISKDCAVCSTKVIYSDDFSLAKGFEEWNLPLSGLQPVTDSTIVSTHFMAWDKIYRRDLIERYNLQFPTGLYYEDIPFWFAYSLLCKNIFYINEFLYIYKRHSKSITGKAFDGKLNRYHDYISGAIWLYDFMNKNGIYNDKFDLYWTCFKCMLNDALCQPGASAKDVATIYKLANDFLSKVKHTGLSKHETLAIKRKVYHNHNIKFMGFNIIKVNQHNVYFLGFKIMKLQ